MSSINVYQFNGRAEQINKASDWTLLDTVSGTFREAVNILNPVIDITPTTQLTQAKILNKGNYVYISDFGRYYFVTDITAVSKDVLRLSLHVDVLMSWATEIRANTVVIERQEKDSASNTYLSDHELKLYNEPYVETYAFTNSFTADNFVLAVAGSRT